MKLTRRQLQKFIMEALIVEAAALTDKFRQDLLTGLDRVLEKNKGKSEPNIILPYKHGRNSTSHDKVVKGLQAFLKDKKYYTMKLDGDWGAGTTNALKAYQRAELDRVDYEDGKLGPKTSKAIKEDLTAKFDTSKIQGTRIEGGVMGYMKSDRYTIQQKEDYLNNSAFKISAEDRKAAEDYIKILKKQKEEKEYLRGLEQEREEKQRAKDQKAVDDFTDSMRRDLNQPAMDKYKSIFGAVKKYAKNVFAAIKAGDIIDSNSLLWASGIGDDGTPDTELSSEEQAYLDRKGIELKPRLGLRVKGDYLHIPLASPYEGRFYVYYINKKETRPILLSDQSKKVTFKDVKEKSGAASLKETRKYGESRGTLYRKRYRRY